MMRRRWFVSSLLLLLLLGACSSTKVWHLRHEQWLDGKYLAFRPPEGEGWKVIGKHLWIPYRKSEGKAEFANMSKTGRGARYVLEVKAYPYRWVPIEILFDKDGDFEARRKYLESTPETLKKNREQGISYSKSWVVYVQGMKCLGNVFSRSHGGLLKELSSKNYLITCGYYHRQEGRRIMRVAYRYQYAGGALRHQQDRATPRKDLMTLKEAEAGLKQAARSVIASLRIKNVDWDRMYREGLIHPDQAFRLSEY